MGFLQCGTMLGTQDPRRKFQRSWFQRDRASTWRCQTDFTCSRKASWKAKLAKAISREGFNAGRLKSKEVGLRSRKSEARDTFHSGPTSTLQGGMRIPALYSSRWWGERPREMKRQDQARAHAAGGGARVPVWSGKGQEHNDDTLLTTGGVQRSVLHFVLPIRTVVILSPFGR